MTRLRLPSHSFLTAHARGVFACAWPCYFARARAAALRAAVQRITGTGATFLAAVSPRVLHAAAAQGAATLLLHA
jgi:hypothetical protein